ncbi:MAG: hypothetical protein K0Q68_3254, partial [Moraxellaceae bacterium]|nr:hypothetical protein [Moraxellaceae bacterium]
MPATCRSQCQGSRQGDYLPARFAAEASHSLAFRRLSYLKNRLNSAFLISTIVNGSGIATSTRNGIVILSGSTASG